MRIPGLRPSAKLALAAGLAGLARPAWASHEGIGFGARSIGMADAVTAVADELDSTAMNPAAAGQLQRSDVHAGIRRIFNTSAGATDINGFTLGAGLPMREPPLEGAFAFLLTHDKVAGLSLDRSLSAVYARRNWREIGAATLDAGLALKMLSRSGRAAGGGIARAAVDLGALLRLSDDRAVGLSLLNVNGPRMDLPSLPDRAPVIGKLGYAQQLKRFKFAMDLTQREPSAGCSGGASGAMGTEYGWSTASFGAFAARTGLTLGGVAHNWSLGGGWRRLGARLDYALRIPLTNGSRWSHAVSLSWLFGAWNPESEYEKVLKSEMSYRRDLARALEAAEIKQWKLAEELKALREQMEGLRRELVAEEANRGQAEVRLQDTERRLKLKDLEDRRRQAQERLKQMQDEQERMRKMNHDLRFAEDWRAYQDLKLQGASELVLIGRLKQMLAEYKGTGVDLGEASRELQRLLSKQP
ncbi:MAG: hypothetical protein HY922_03005 [Elusimicrobia bacterium]|nr:hypothetical protein [Elusimicrobiota bacterium]